MSATEMGAMELGLYLQSQTTPWNGEEPYPVVPVAYVDAETGSYLVGYPSFSLRGDLYSGVRPGSRVSNEARFNNW